MAARPSDEEFTEFVDSAWAGLYRTAYLMVGDHGLAEDLVQTALTKTYGAWGRVRDRAAAPAYARRTLINTAASWFRRRDWRAERPSEHLPEAARVEDGELRSTVMTALAALPPRQRAVVVLRFYDDLSVAETARLLGCAEGTVKAQTHSALKTLRVRLGDAVIPEGAGHD